MQRGDEALIRNESERNKLAPTFHPEPMVVKRNEGIEVVVDTQEGVKKCRNSTYAKSYNPEQGIVGRPSRERKVPAKLNDYVVEVR